MELEYRVTDSTSCFTVGRHVRVDLSIKSKRISTHVLVYFDVQLLSVWCSGTAEPLSTTSPRPSTSATVSPVTVQQIQFLSLTNYLKTEPSAFWHKLLEVTLSRWDYSEHYDNFGLSSDMDLNHQPTSLPLEVCW